MGFMPFQSFIFHQDSEQGLSRVPRHMYITALHPFMFSFTPRSTTSV